MNRFFFRCKRCLFRFTVERDTRSAPYIDNCPCCQAVRVDCLGATRGVFSMQVPCDSRCTYATGNHCTCSCGGKNHGSQILVPVVSGIVDLSHYPAPELATVKAEFAAMRAELAAIADSLPSALKTAAADASGGVWLPRGSWERQRDYKGAVLRVWQSATYAGRKARLRDLRAEFAPDTVAPELRPAPAPAQLTLNLA